jgi:hypothetical protein
MEEGIATRLLHVLKFECSLNIIFYFYLFGKNKTFSLDFKIDHLEAIVEII